MGDFAKMMRKISEIYYPDVSKIILVTDNLNTHCYASFYTAFPPETALDLMRKFEFHYTPKHGSWLNIAETELSSLSMQCSSNNTFIEGEVICDKRFKHTTWEVKLQDAYFLPSNVMVQSLIPSGLDGAGMASIPALSPSSESPRQTLS